MMSSASNRGDSRPAPQARTQDQQAVGSRMLEQILMLTGGRPTNVGFVEPQDMQALVDVARNLAGRPFLLEPVAVELVHAMLLVQFTKAGIPAPTLRAMAVEIATTLYDDPTSRERLEALWRGLSDKEA